MGALTGKKSESEIERKMSLPWYKDKAVWRWTVWRYLPWLAVLNLAWEFGQLPLYTIWDEAPVSYRAFAAVHCTVADVLVGFTALVTSLLILRAGGLSTWRLTAIGTLVVVLTVIFTAYSEWLNTAVWENWAYSARMPTLRIGGFILGLSPLAQWLVLPPLALWLAGTGTTMAPRHR